MKASIVIENAPDKFKKVLNLGITIEKITVPTTIIVR